MKNKKNITRQIYLTLLGKSNNTLKEKVEQTINYKDIRPFEATNPCAEIPLAGEPGTIRFVPGIEPRFQRHYIRKNNQMPSVYSSPYTFPVDNERVRMFMFRYYKGKVDWNKLFFGNKKREG